MSLFQKSVVQKYINALDSSLLDSKYHQFQSYFGNVSVQENIRNSKEEQFQEGFLRELFVKILGYTINPNPEYNLTTELKNIVNSKKVDGAILKDNIAIAVIELKGTDTTDLDKIEAQAFSYKHHQPGCSYVITSNFEKLRFYIDNAVEHVDFDLFHLSREQFSHLWLCLAKDNLINDLPKKIKETSFSKEENITKSLYADYSKFRNDIFDNLVKKNPGIDKLVLFKKTQKLLDRFLFVFFAEDRLLVPPNSITEIINQWETLKDLNVYIPLYERFKTYFGYMNTGHKDKRHDIYAYNGGLFSPDVVLDNIRIDDDILYKNTLALSRYDFETDVDVNILGHIFEHSLSEIESLQAEINGEQPDTQRSKRKKDGIFYTPKYITKYIVENTVGKLCDEKRAELEIIDEEYAKGRKSRQKTIIKSLDNKLNTYQAWLLQLTILDPACGSGAFLNQALDFLIEEHRKIDELRAQLLESDLVFSDITTDILERNIYGVDLNEESVEIAKLSLWLRTAQRGRKLSKLNNNIKCGNSLIDDPDIAGSKAFDWQHEFPDVFAKGGFNVVIGNPPYGAKIDKEAQEYLNKRYIKGGSETAISFIKLSYDNLLASSGKFGFIIPKAFTFSSNYQSIREYIVNDITEIIDCKKVWKEVLLEQIIFFFQKGKATKKFTSGIIEDKEFKTLGEIDKSTFEEFGFFLNGVSSIELELGQKINSSKKYINDIANNSRGGIFQRLISENGDTNVLGGAEIQRHGIVNIKGNINRSEIIQDEKSFIQNNSILVQRIVAHIENPTDHIKITACYPEDRNYAIVDTINQITFDKEYDPKVFWLILNSKLINWYAYRFIYAKAIRTMQFDNPVTSRIPTKINFDQQPFIIKADRLLCLYKELQNTVAKLHRTLQREFALAKLSKKLDSWYDLSYADFLKELNKHKVSLTLSQKAEWEDYFLTEQTKALTINSEIEIIDNEIDQMVYQLYELTEEEIDIIEY